MSQGKERLLKHFQADTKKAVRSQELRLEKDNFQPTRKQSGATWSNGGVIST